MKKIAVINDLSGFGRCSLTAAIPIISVSGSECSPLPTAILSNQTGYESFYCDDYTDKIDFFTSEWKKLNKSFDGILTGFLGSIDGVDKVLNFIKTFKTEKTILVVDPVMADDGEIYSTYNKKFCSEIKKLVSVSNVITPNLTELCILTEKDFSELLSHSNDDDYFEIIVSLAKEVLNDCLKTVIVTGIEKGDSIFNMAVSENDSFTVHSKKMGNGYSGTGDIFSAIIVSQLVNGKTIKSAVKTATSFLEKAIEDSFNEGTDANDGVNFEKYLGELIP
ncbi:MAG: pyridoxamine kinase [Oscillospiraceae bacterium]